MKNEKNDYNALYKKINNNARFNKVTIPTEQPALRDSSINKG